MKYNSINVIRLWWHCLIHWHQSGLISGGHNPEIGCMDCEEEDEFDKARQNVAKECFKQGKTITGTMYSDGTYELKGGKDDKIHNQ